MKETILSICERNFILNAAAEYKRLDGRKLDEFRNFNVYFGTDLGLCYTALGETRVITQVSCEIQQPKTTRPNEGLLHVNVEISSMAAPHIEPGRSTDISNHLNRLLEKCIKDSKAVDLESLCLVSEEKVWALRVDVNILNHDGNLIQAASISSLAALAHFKRPDVTTNGEEIIIHDISERDPISITLHHHPVCITFALLNNGENVLADPTSMEERIADANLVFGVNAYGEICGLHLGGNALVEPSLILKYSQKATMVAKDIVNRIKEALKNDSKVRQAKEPYGLVECVHWDKIRSLTDSRLKIQLRKFNPGAFHKMEFEVEDTNTNPDVIDLGDNSAELVPIQRKKNATPVHEEEDDKMHLDIQQTVKQIDRFQTGNIIQTMSEDYGEGGNPKWEMDVDVKSEIMEGSNSGKSDEELQRPQKTEYDAVASGDSEEEVVVMKSEDMDNPKETSKSGKAKADVIFNIQQKENKNDSSSKKKRRKTQKRS